MRQYRAWHKAEKVMCEVSLINFELGAFLIGVKPGKGEICGDQIVIAPDNGRFCNWDEIELMESTGLKDRNKNEIHKGDIVIYEDYDSGSEDLFRNKGIVVYESSIASYSVTNRQSVELEDLFTGDILVIGNIHENPDLV